MKMDHVSIMCSDLDASMNYYNCLLPLIGFRQLRPQAWVNGDGLYLQFRQANPDTKPYERFGAGVNHIGFSAPTIEDVQRIQMAMRNHGFDVADIQAFGDVRALFLKDRDGFRFEVSYYPAGEQPIN